VVPVVQIIRDGQPTWHGCWRQGGAALASAGRISRNTRTHRPRVPRASTTSVSRDIADTLPARSRLARHRAAWWPALL